MTMNNSSPQSFLLFLEVLPNVGLTTVALATTARGPVGVYCRVQRVDMGRLEPLKQCLYPRYDTRKRISNGVGSFMAKAPRILTFFGSMGTAVTVGSCFLRQMAFLSDMVTVFGLERTFRVQYVNVCTYHLFSNDYFDQGPRTPRTYSASVHRVPLPIATLFPMDGSYNGLFSHLT